VKKKIHTHYDNLKISRNAPDEVIKAAYKALSQKYHPDKNARPDASKVMAILNNSYAVLSDQQRRRKHDEWIASEEQASASPRASAGSERTARAERNERGTGRPRAESPAPRSKARAPKPPVADAWQTWNSDLTPRRIFMVLCCVLIAAALVFLALHEKQVLSSLPSATDIGNADRSLEEKAAAVITMVDAQSSPAKEVSDGQVPQNAISAPQVTPPQAAKVELSVGPDGHPWPLGPKIYRDNGLRKDGQSTITIDNSRNAHAVFVKLGAEPRPDEMSGELYIPARRLLALENLSSGAYRLKYRDLQTGATMQARPILLQEMQAALPVQNSAVVITLYTSPLDNVDFHPIGESEF
jgi:hypothetical protein